MKRILVLMLLALVILPSCAEAEEVNTDALPSAGDVVIPIEIKVNGISAWKSEVIVSNFHAGAEVDVFYRITNSTDEPTSPSIYMNRKVDPDKYPKAVGYEIAPLYVEDWLVLPTVTVPPGKTKDTIVKMIMPDDFGKTPSKMAFCTGVAEDTGGMYQTAVETWWLVEMR